MDLSCCFSNQPRTIYFNDNILSDQTTARARIWPGMIGNCDEHVPIFLIIQLFMYFSSQCNLADVGEGIRTRA